MRVRGLSRASGAVLLAQMLLALPALADPSPPTLPGPGEGVPDRRHGAFRFCDAVGPNPLVVVSQQGPRAVVRVAPLVIEVSESAPRVVVPVHTDDRWPRREVPTACLRESAPALVEKLAENAGASVVLASSADLVFGCSADAVGPAFLDGRLDDIERAPGAPRTNTCLRNVDVRAPCPSSDGDDDPSFDARRQEAIAATRQRLARVVPRFSAGGPALLVRAEPTASASAIFLIERLLENEACGCGDNTAAVVSTRVVRLRVPALLTPAELLIAVPRYVGASYDLVRAPPDASGDDLDAEAITRLDWQDTFTSPAPDEEDVVRVFSAPESCPCDCNEER